MLKNIKSFICYLLTFAMLMTLLPPQAYEASTSMENVSGQENYNDVLQAPYADAQEGVSLGENVSIDNTSLEDAEIVMELVERRTEYSKEYKLDNGLNLAVVYSEPVHYKENGKWKEIDNTLKAHGSGSSASYKNKAGAWQVEFPQEMEDGSAVTITKNAYKVSFVMAGELRTSARAFAVSNANARKSRGKVHTFDYSKQKKETKHPEVIPDKLKSRMTYSDIYNNTDVVYDLEPYQLKESIVIRSYDSAVYGYVYMLDTGKLVPVLNEDGSVDLTTSKNGEVVMTMPAPFMIDDEGEVCMDVSVTLEKVKGEYQITYLLPMEWMAAENRAWPVVLDPAVKVEPGTKTNNIQDHFVAENYSASNTHKYLYAGHHATYGDMRTYIRFSEIPDFTAADVVVNAKLKLQYSDGSSGSTTVEAHQVYDSWTTGSITWAGLPSWNSTVQDYCVVGNSGEYSWDITDIAYGWYLGENTGVMLKATASIENGSAANWKQFCSVEYNKTNTTYWPYLEITYQTATGIEDYWDYTTTSAGRVGDGYINNTTGNMTWIHSDLGFDGNLMPVSISHIFNLSERTVDAFGVGKGWRTNFHQTVERADTGGYYIWTDGDGTKHHFNQKGSTGTYVDEDGLRLTLTIHSSGYIITDIYGNTSNFDSYGRLTSMVNNQTIKSGITITYNGTTNRIATITDGVNRVYKFTYDSSNLLNKISYHGKKNADGTIGPEIAYVTFEYSSSKLTKITYADGLDSHFTYDGTKLISVKNIDDYKVQFGYSTGITKRVVSVQEYHKDIAGNKISIAYAHNKTKISDSKHSAICHYNDFGNLISSQDEEGNGGFYEYTANKYTQNLYSKNQLKLASKGQTTVKNLILDNSFEGGTNWTASSVASAQVISTKGYMGNKSLQVTVNNSSAFTGAYGSAITLQKGETCSFSAYVQCVTATVQLGLGTTTTPDVTSASHSPGAEWGRLEVSYTNPNDSAVTIRPQIILSTGGIAYVDCIQAELTGGASSYNLIQNGDFSQSMYWSSSAGRTTLSASAVPQLDKTVYKMTGSPTGSQSIYQTVNVSGNKGDVFVLSGWAKGNSVPLNNTSRQFGLKITFNAVDGRTSETIISCNSAYDASNDWQYIA